MNPSGSISSLRVFSLLCASFWVIPRRLNFKCRRFGTLCLFHLHRQVGACRMLADVFHGWVAGPSHNPQPGGPGDFFFKVFFLQPLQISLSTARQRSSCLCENKLCSCRSQWPRGLSRGSAGACFLELQVRIPLASWMSLSLGSVVRCQVEVCSVVCCQLEVCSVVCCQVEVCSVVCCQVDVCSVVCCQVEVSATD